MCFVKLFLVIKFFQRFYLFLYFFAVHKAKIICITNPITITIVKPTIHQVSFTNFSVCFDDCLLNVSIVVVSLLTSITAFLMRSFAVAARSRSIPLPVFISGKSVSFIILCFYHITDCLLLDCGFYTTSRNF